MTEALSRLEWEAQQATREATPPEPPTPPNPFIAPEGEQCGLTASCGGKCSLTRGHHHEHHACAPDPGTGKESCPAGGPEDVEDEPEAPPAPKRRRKAKR